MGHKNANLTLLVPPEIKIKLVAIAYQQGHLGMFGRVSRQFLQDGIDRYTETLPPGKRKDLDEITQAVRLRVEMGKVVKADALHPDEPDPVEDITLPPLG